MRPSFNPYSQMREAKIKKCSLTSISSLTCKRSKSRPRLQQRTTTARHYISTSIMLLTSPRSESLTLVIGAPVPVRLSERPQSLNLWPKTLLKLQLKRKLCGSRWRSSVMLPSKLSHFSSCWSSPASSSFTSTIGVVNQKSAHSARRRPCKCL